MSKSSDGLFKSINEQSLAEFVENPSRYFLVPAYQRYFVWEKNEISQLFEDLIEGLKNALGTYEREYITFIGALTGFEDSSYRKIESKPQQYAPDYIISIVDGQQRLTTLMVGAILFHDYIRVVAQKNESKWPTSLSQRVWDRLEQLSRIYEVERKTAGGEYYYPKMIRIFDDAWALNEKDCRYHSPLSHLIHSYGNHARKEYKQVKEGEKKKYTQYSHSESYPASAELSEEDKTAHDIFSTRVGQVKQIIGKYCNNKSGDRSEEIFPDFFNEKINNRYVTESIFELEKRQEDHEDREIDLEDKDTKKIILALLLSSYFLNRIRFVALISKNVDQSSEIFGKLNATGLSLSAIETFKSEVIQDLYHGDNIEEYQNADAKKYFDDIDSYIRTFGKLMIR